MKKEDIFLSDVKRILIGNAPPEFMLEVFLRTLLIYLFLLVVVRLLGKRMKAQLSIMEMAVMLTLGAIVSPAMQLPERGVAVSALVLVAALLIQRGITWLGVKSERFEQLTQGRMMLLVKDGILQLDTMRRATITREEIFARLRAKEVHQLGAVDRLYLEACGVFSLYKAEDDTRPGLSVLPTADRALLEVQPVAEGRKACVNCGRVEPAPVKACSSCGSVDWIKAIL